MVLLWLHTCTHTYVHMQLHDVFPPMQEYPINFSVDACSRVENALSADSTCYNSFTSIISILSSDATGVTVGQLDGFFDILCQGSCGNLVSRYFTACKDKIVSICT